MTNYQSAVKRIHNAKTLEAIEKIEQGLERVYNVGQLTVSEFSRLCDKATERMIEITFYKELRGISITEKDYLEFTDSK